MGGSSSNDGGAGGSTSSSQAGMTGSERTADSEARASRDRPDDNDRGGARETKETFDRAMDNANRPDRAPASPPETTTVADDDDLPDRAAGPPGIGAPPSSSVPTDTAKETDDNDDQEERGILDRVADTLTVAPTDAEGNARSTSPVADRINNTKDYSFEDLRSVFVDEPVLTPEQSLALADGAAVMDGYTRPPATPRDAAMEMANAELSVGLAVQRREIETLTDKQLDHIDKQLADAKAHRADALERFEASHVSMPQLGSGFKTTQLADDLKVADNRVTSLEEDREAVEQARALPGAIERGFMAEDMYNVESHLRGSHMERLEDPQLPDGLKTNDMVNPETGFVAGIYENRRSGTVELVARGTDFGLSKEEFAVDMMANGGQGVGMTTEQYEQAQAIGEEFADAYGNRENMPSAIPLLEGSARQWLGLPA